MKYTIYITAIIVTNCIFICSSCSEPEELTPKTASVTTDYLVTTGTILTAEDRAEVQARWDEYNEAINQ